MGNYSQNNHLTNSKTDLFELFMDQLQFDGAGLSALLCGAWGFIAVGDPASLSPQNTPQNKKAVIQNRETLYGE